MTKMDKGIERERQKEREERRERKVREAERNKKEIEKLLTVFKRHLGTFAKVF